MEKRIIINNYIENDPLSENNLNKTLDLVNDIRLSSPQKSIWIYSGFVWENVMEYQYPDDVIFSDNDVRCTYKRNQIISQCDVLIDGQYIEAQRDISLPYRGSKNQRLIDVQQSLQKGEIVLWK